MRVQHQPAVVLRTRAWSESSWIVDFLTPGYGRVTGIAKGARRLKSRTRPHLMPFRHLEIGWSGKGELPTVTAVEPTRKAFNLRGENLLCGWYMNELVLRLLPRMDAHAALFEQYGDALESLDDEHNAQAVLRWFELNLLQQTGYGLVLDAEITTGSVIEPGQKYRYIVDRGPVFENVVAERERVSRVGGVAVRGETLLALDSGDLSQSRTRNEARELLRAVIDRQLDGRPLRTRRALRQMRNLLAG